MISVTSDLLTYVPQIDAQHKELFELINKAEVTAMSAENANSKEETENALKFLGEYIIKHFGDEEQLMLKSGYPKYEWHRTWHQWYISEFDGLKAEYAKNGPSKEFTEILNKSVIRWIVKHIKTVDVVLGQHINSKK